MRIEQLRYIYEIIAAGSLRSAADHLHTTQQNLSAYVANLEKEIGTKLFIRTPEGMQLTDDGKKLIPLFKELTSTYEKILNMGARQDIISDVKGKLSFACHFTITRFISSSILDDFCSLFPNIDLTLIEVYTDDINDILEDENELDVILFPIDQENLSKIITPNGFSVRTVAKDSLVLVCGKDSPLAKRRKVAISSLKDQPYVAFFSAKPEETWTFKKIFLNHGVQPARLSQCNVESLYLKRIASGCISISTKLTSKHTNYFKPYQISSVPFKEDTSFYYAIATKDSEPAHYLSKLVKDTLQRYLD